jgi:hypothetical protein
MYWRDVQIHIFLILALTGGELQQSISKIQTKYTVLIHRQSCDTLTKDNTIIRKADQKISILEKLNMIHILQKLQSCCCLHDIQNILGRTAKIKAQNNNNLMAAFQGKA